MTWQLKSPKASDPREGKVEDAMSSMTRAQKSHIVIAGIAYWLQRSALFSVGGD